MWSITSQHELTANIFFCSVWLISELFDAQSCHPVKKCSGFTEGKRKKHPVEAYSGWVLLCKKKNQNKQQQNKYYFTDLLQLTFFFTWSLREPCHSDWDSPMTHWTYIALSRVLKDSAQKSRSKTTETKITIPRSDDKKGGAHYWLVFGVIRDL